MRRGELLSESLRFWRGADAPSELASDLIRLGVVTSAAGDFDGARVAFEEAVELGRQLGDKRLTSSALNNLGELARLGGELATAREHYEQSLELELESGLGSAYAIALRRLNLGGLALDEGDDAAAEQHVLAALESSLAISSDDMTLSCIEVLAAVAARRGDARHAARLLGAAEEQRERLGFVLPADRAAADRRDGGARRRCARSGRARHCRISRRLVANISPAQNALSPAPVSTTTPTVGSFAACVIACVSSS